jgi:hypothetical protein
MRILSKHQIIDPEAFLLGANAALIKGLPKFRLRDRRTVASNAYFVWEAPSEQELREFIERDFAAAGVSLLRIVPEHHPVRPPQITGIFPFSITIVQGTRLGDVAGQFWLLLSTSGTKYELTNLQWGNTFAAGVIPWDIAGVPDQPAFLQVIRTDGWVSNEWPVNFTAARVSALLRHGTDAGIVRQWR